MPSAYLNDSDKAAYDAPNATPVQIQKASAMIDGYLQRPEGLVYGVDANGNPCYMVNKAPVTTLTISGAISPGANVVVPVVGGVSQIMSGSPQSGQVCVIDRAIPSVTEACIAIGADPIANTVTLQSVQFPHFVSSLMEFEMTIYEESVMPKGRTVTNLSRTPLRLVIGGQGRYAYGRRGDNYIDPNVNSFNLLASISTFGGPPIWEIFNQTRVDIEPNSGQVWAPAGIMMAYYTEIRWRYIAGWPYEALPQAIKFAVSQLIQSAAVMPGGALVSRYQAGDTSITKFGSVSSLLDADMLNSLEPYKAHAYA